MKNNNVKLNSLSEGDVFFYDSDYYLKTEMIDVLNTRSGYINAVNFREGILVDFPLDLPVIPKLNAKLIFP